MGDFGAKRIKDKSVFLSQLDVKRDQLLKMNQHRQRFFIDKESIMNVGDEVRARHGDYIMLELNTLMYGSEFYLD